jgi:hypothetical protein
MRQNTGTPQRFALCTPWDEFARESEEIGQMKGKVKAKTRQRQGKRQGKTKQYETRRGKTRQDPT